MSSARVTFPIEKFGGQMSAGELQFLRQVRGLLQATLEGRIPFPAALENLLKDFREIRKADFDADAALATGWTPTVASLAQLQSAGASRAALSTADHAFLQDMDGFLDYAMRNGITFLWVLTGVMHDVSEIGHYSWSVDVAASDHFSPKVTGWAERNKAVYGDSESDTE